MPSLSPLSTGTDPAIVRRRNLQHFKVLASLLALSAFVPVALASSASAVSVASCEDVSPSFPSDVRIRFNEALLAKVSSFADVPSSSPRSALPAKPGLKVVVRPISRNSYASDNAVELNLSPLPSISVLKDDESAETTINRLRAKKLRATSVAANKAKVVALATALRNWTPPLRRGSDVIGCVLAAASLLSGTEKILYIVSDLEATTDPIDAGVKLNDIKVVVIQTCVKATECMTLRTQWETQLRTMGAASVTFYRPEQLPDSIRL